MNESVEINIEWSFVKILGWLRLESITNSDWVRFIGGTKICITLAPTELIQKVLTYGKLIL